MNQAFLSTALLFPFELLLPVLGILLIQSESPINSLIYRSFLGSIAALIYAIVGAPDVALTEVMVGTLLSSLIYIVTIRSCYSIVVIVDKELSVHDNLRSCLNGVFDELHLRVIYQEENFSSNSSGNFDFLSSSRNSGSPHALLEGNKLYFEVQSLLDDVKATKLYGDLSQHVDVSLVR